MRPSLPVICFYCILIEQNSALHRKTRPGLFMAAENVVSRSKAFGSADARASPESGSV